MLYEVPDARFVIDNQGNWAILSGCFHRGPASVVFDACIQAKGALLNNSLSSIADSRIVILGEIHCLDENSAENRREMRRGYLSCCAVVAFKETSEG